MLLTWFSGSGGKEKLTRSFLKLSERHQVSVYSGSEPRQGWWKDHSKGSSSPFWAGSTFRTLGLPFLMTRDLELGVPEVSLVSGLERFGGVLTQEVMGALWEGRELVGWEQFWKWTQRHSGVLQMMLQWCCRCSPQRTMKDKAFLFSLILLMAFLTYRKRKGYTSSRPASPAREDEGSLPRCCKLHKLRKCTAPVGRKHIRKVSWRSNASLCDSTLRSIGGQMERFQLNW